MRFAVPEVTTSDPDLTHVPFTAKHPAVRLRPFARVEEAVDEVRLRIVPLMPAKVEVPEPDWKN